MLIISVFSIRHDNKTYCINVTFCIMEIFFIINEYHMVYVAEKYCDILYSIRS